MQKTMDKIGPAAGLFAAALLFASGLINDIQVSATSSSSTIAAALTRNQAPILLGTYMMMLGVVFLIMFVAFVRHFLVRTQGDHWLVSAAFGGGLVTAAMLLLAAHFSQAFTVLQDYGSETQVAKALYLLDWNWYLVVEAPAIAVMVGSISVFALLRKALPRWTSLSGLLLAVLLLAPAVAGSGIMLAYLWLGGLAVAIFMRKPEDGRV